MAKHVKIVGGPSKWDLMVSLFEGNPQDRKKVIFGLEQALPNQQRVIAIGLKGTIALEVAITEVSQEDGSGESWCFSGWSNNMQTMHYSVKGYFSTNSRKGWILEEER